MTDAEESDDFVITSVPKSLFTIPTEGMAEGEVLDSIWVGGFTEPPAVGALCLVFPTGERSQLRRITHLYRVTGSEATKDREWPWVLYFDHCAAPQPQPWHDITEHLMFEGLKTVTGVSGEGDRVTHRETLAAVFELLGFRF